MSSRTINLATVTCVALMVIGISLIVSRGPLYGRAENDNWVPDLRGEWIGEVVGYGYESVTDPLDLPAYGEGPLSNDGNIFITNQNGRVFAGEFELDEGKLTGVILPDRTVSIQLFEQSEQRFFLTGRLTTSGGTLQISGYVHVFDDFQHRHQPYEESEKIMASAYVQLVKVN